MVVDEVDDVVVVDEVDDVVVRCRWVVEMNQRSESVTVHSKPL
jgi:hypothetical protein